jgi:hypothetical protein
MLPDMQKAMDELFKWSCKDHGYISKNTRIREWNQKGTDDIDYYKILCRIMAGVFTNPQGMTYQAMIGYISGDIGCANPLDRAKCAAEVIAIAYRCGLIVITKVSDKTFMITTDYELDEPIPEFPKHQPEFSPPEPQLFNPILGNNFKQHEEDVCVDHIDRMNAIPFKLDMRIINTLEETTKADLETDEQREQWEDFKRRSKETYQDVIRNGNIYWHKHGPDTRGRTYCGGYYLNYQGTSFKKAITQLANKEVVQL